MASLAIPLLEAVALRVLAALGIGAAAGAAGEVARDAAKQRSEEADEAKSSPVARTDAQTKAKEKCKECPPDKGGFVRQPTAGWSEMSIAYQFRICGLPVGPDFITEWFFNGVQFDGFDPSQCLLKEAKGRYDQFFDEFGGVLEWWLRGEEKMFNEAMRQGVAAQPRPPTRLRWHFLQPISYRYFSRIIQAAYPDVEVVYQL